MRPVPPDELFDFSDGPVFRPSRELIEWARETFIDDGGPLYNPEHRHLNQATIGALWTNVPNGRQGRSIVGQCERGLPMGSKWSRARAERQLLDWFGAVPDFVLTFDAEYAQACSDAEWCALVEHELLHAGQERDAFGAPKFRKTGLPAFTLRGHDVQEFVSIVRRYGADAAHVREMVEAGNAEPTVARASIGHACGTCNLRLVA